MHIYSIVKVFLCFLSAILLFALPYNDNHYLFHGDLYFSSNNKTALDAEVRLFVPSNGKRDTVGIDYIKKDNKFLIELPIKVFDAAMANYKSDLIIVQGKLINPTDSISHNMIREYSYTLNKRYWWNRFIGANYIIEKLPTIKFKSS